MDPPAWSSGDEFRYRQADETNRARSPGSSDEAELRDSQPHVSQGEATVANATEQHDGVDERETGPEYKDQVRQAVGDIEAQVVVAQQADNIIPLAESVHVVVEEDTPADPPTLPAVGHILEQDSEEDEQILEEDSEDEQILEEDLPKAAMKMRPSGINAKNTLGTINCKSGAAKRPVSMPQKKSSAANNSPPIAPTKTPPRVARKSSNNLNLLLTDSPQAAPKAAANRQPGMHRKRKIWAGSLVLGVVVVVVVVVIAVIAVVTKSPNGEMEPPSEEIKLPMTEAPAEEIRLPTTESPTEEIRSPPTESPTEEIKLTASDGATYDTFGQSVAINGDTIVIGANEYNKDNDSGGRAYVYTLSGSVWTEQAKLMASDGAAEDQFGVRVAADGGTIVIGAHEDDTENGNRCGSAYVYTFTGTVWTEKAKLTASDGAEFDNFGTSVAIGGDTIVIGADEWSKNNDTGGRAYVYTRSGSGWTEQAKLTASDGAEDDEFGSSVAVDGETIIIGAHWDGAKRGSAYVYTLSASAWTEQTKLTASDGAAEDQFGRSLAMDGDTIVIGASEINKDNNSGGRAYVYTLSGSVWTEQTKLTASDGAGGDLFGFSVAIDGDTIVIGARWDSTENGENTGSAYVYTRSGTVWTEQIKLVVSDGAAFDNFGNSVAVNGGIIVIGAVLDDTENGEESGSAYIFYQ